MRKLMLIVIVALLSGCINDPTKQSVDCKGIIHIETLGRDYSVKLKAKRTGNSGTSYYTDSPQFVSPWVNADNFKRIECK